MVRVGINGFGRVGRQVLKALLERNGELVQPVVVNDLCPVDTSAHLFKYDSVYGVYGQEVTAKQNSLSVGKKTIKHFAYPDPADLPWSKENVDIVIEATGRFRTREAAQLHLKAGARKVIISAPAPDADITLCMGVNHRDYRRSKHQIISNASCTANCLAPVAKVVERRWGIARGFFSTVHAMTNSQNLVDGPARDLRRARAAGQNIVPTSSGAPTSLGLIMPGLKDKIEGFSVRVPTATVSLLDLTLVLKKRASTQALHRALVAAAARGPLKEILAWESQELASADYKQNPHSSVVDFTLTKVKDGVLAKIVAWFDNEWAYACRLADLVALIARK